MSLIQTLVVRNDALLVVDNIKFHLDSGVDHIVITDHRSTDGMRDHLDQYIRQGVLTYRYQDELEFRQSEWVTEMAHFAHTYLKANWIINSDSDEFWVATNGGRLRDEIFKQKNCNVLVGKRHDFLCLAKSSGPFWESMVYRKNVSRNLQGAILSPKMAHLSAHDVSVGPGNHRVFGFDKICKRESILEVLHFPIRSAEQYQNKVKLGGASLSVYDRVSPILGRRWRNHADELRETGEIGFLNDNLYSETQIQDGLSDNSVVEDTRVRNKMRDLSPRLLAEKPIWKRAIGWATENRVRAEF